MKNENNIASKVMKTYQKVEDSFTEHFLQKDDLGNLKLKSSPIEERVVDTYKKIEENVVNQYQKIEVQFVDTFLSGKKDEE